MKRKIFLPISLAFAAVTILFNACKKDDSTSPVVTLTGASEMTISLNSSFSDPGATANDDKDGTVTATASGTVDKDTKGDYVITYEARDAAGNVGSASRTVHVVNDAESWGGTYAVHDSCGPT